jgi:predicted permease
VLVVVQVALSMLFLIGSGLFVRSLANAGSIDPGFDPGNLLFLSVDLVPKGYEPAAGQAFYRQTIERLETLPGVDSVSIAELIDLGIGGQRRAILAEGYALQANENQEVNFNRVGPGFFETMRMPIVRGRSFSGADREGAPAVVIVNESFARRYWPGEDPLGKRASVSGADGPWMSVIGIARDAKYRSLADDALPFYYLPLYQHHQQSATFLLRTRGRPAALEAAAKAEIAAIDRMLPVFDVKTGEDHLRFALLPAQLAGATLGVFGLLALALAVIGIYGVMSYSIAQRTREIGIRVALGAERRVVLSMVVGQGMRLAATGMTIGLAGALAVTRFASAFLYGISPTDPVTFIAIALLLSAAALLACYVPARRASRVDPIRALRYE